MNKLSPAVGPFIYLTIFALVLIFVFKKNYFNIRTILNFQWLPYLLFLICGVIFLNLNNKINTLSNNDQNISILQDKIIKLENSKGNDSFTDNAISKFSEISSRGGIDETIFKKFNYRNQRNFKYFLCLFEVNGFGETKLFSGDGEYTAFVASDVIKAANSSEDTCYKILDSLEKEYTTEMKLNITKANNITSRHILYFKNYSEASKIRETITTSE